MAVVLVVAALALLVVSASIGSSAHPIWLTIIYVLAQWTGPLLLLAAAALVVRRRLSSWVRDQLIELAGPALISTMPPRTVLSAVLARVFGDKVGHQEVATALLGGGGRDPGARDTAVSKDSTVSIRLERISDASCLSEFAWSHEFSGVRNNHHYVMFATTDPEIFGCVNRERTYPLFEAWFLETDDQLEDFVPGLRERLDVGVSYRDVYGVLHRVEPAFRS